MIKALVLLALPGLFGCASGVVPASQTTTPQMAAASVTLPRHQIATASRTVDTTDVPLKPMTASQSAARMN
jgi:hypothetical protein